MWQPRWKGKLGEMNTCICMAEPLHCSPQTIITLLIGYTQKKKKKLWSLGDYDVSTFTSCDKCTTLMRAIENGETVFWGIGYIQETSILPLVLL